MSPSIIGWAILVTLIVGLLIGAVWMLHRQARETRPDLEARWKRRNPTYRSKSIDSHEK